MSKETTCPTCKSSIIVNGSTTDFAKCKKCGAVLEIIWIKGDPRAVRSS